jgi:hypothetical protein
MPVGVKMSGPSTRALMSRPFWRSRHPFSVPDVASLKIDAAMFDKLLAREARDVRKNVEIS